MMWTNAGILLFGPLGTNFSEILIKIQNFSFMKMQLKTSSAKWQPFCLSLTVLTATVWTCNWGQSDELKHELPLLVSSKLYTAFPTSHHKITMRLSLTYCPTSNIRCTYYQNLNVYCLILQLCLPNPFKPGIKSRMKMPLTSDWSTMLLPTKVRLILEVLWYLYSCYQSYTLVSPLGLQWVWDSPITSCLLYMYSIIFSWYSMPDLIFKSRLNFILYYEIISNKNIISITMASSLLWLIPQDQWALHCIRKM